MVGWIVINDVKNMEVDKVVVRNEIRIPSCVLRVEKEIKEVRATISKCCAELKRLQHGGRLTRKTKRNRKKISEQCGEITCYNLVCYIEKLKKRIKYPEKFEVRKLDY